MGDLVKGGWQTREERVFMRALDAEIARLTRLVAALREAHACERTNRSAGTSKVIDFSVERSRRAPDGSI